MARSQTNQQCHGKSKTPKPNPLNIYITVYELAVLYDLSVQKIKTG